MSPAPTPIAPLPSPLSKARRLDLALITGDTAALQALSLPTPVSLLSGDLPALLPTSTSSGHPLSSAIEALLTLPLQDSSALPECSLHSYAAAIAVLHAFLRCNFTGPSLSFDGAVNPVLAAAAKAPADLSLDGESAAAPVAAPALLLAAKRVLVDGASALVAEGFVFARWWAARASLAHHLVLARPTPTLHRHIFESFDALLGDGASAGATLRKHRRNIDVEEAAEVDARVSGGELDLRGRLGEHERGFGRVGEELLALAHVELCMAQQYFYDSEGAVKSLQSACSLAKMTVRVRGQLGVRTKFQQTPVSQLVARAFAAASDGMEEREPLSALRQKFPRGGDHHGENEEGAVPLPKNVPLNDSDALGYIKLLPDEDVGTEGDSSGAREVELLNLTPLEQSIVLAHGAVELSRSASHTLTEEQAAPFVARILSSVDSVYGTSSMLQIRAQVLRTRFERDRGRYMERSMTQMETVAQFLDSPCLGASDDVAAERVALLFASGLPPRWELKKELAVSFGRLGLVKSAMEIFRELQLWDDLVDCHRLIGNLGAAEELVRDQLAELDVAVDIAMVQQSVDEAKAKRAERRPRLLCVLGDVTRDPELYFQAWTESQERCGRAKRSLGRHYVERKEWGEAVEHFRDALKLNPLFPDVWFTYGCAAVELGDMALAASAFTHVVQETPDNGEAWNNLGRVLCEVGRTKEGLSALLMAAKTKRDSWRIWDNVLHVATLVKASPEIVKAMEQLIDLRGNEGLSATPLLVAVDDVVRTAADGDPSARAAIAHTSRALLKLLARATTLRSSDAALWAAYARLHSIVPGKESRRKSAECRQKQIRALVSQRDWRVEAGAFREMVDASLAFANAAVDTEDDGLVHAASLHVGSVISQCQESFSTHEAFELLREARATLSASERM